MRVVVVDDQELMRRGLTMLLGTEDGVSVVGEAGDGHAALAVIAATAPDIVLTDARMPVMDGVSLAAAVRQAYPELPVVILTTFDDDDLVQRALGAGAAGFLLKDATTEELVLGMRLALKGGLVIDPRVARSAFTTRARGADRASTSAEPFAVLTRAEQAVARLVATGATNSEIAQTLYLVEGTVKNHVSALLRKLDQRDRTALALLLARYLGH